MDFENNFYFVKMLQDVLNININFYFNCLYNVPHLSLWANNISENLGRYIYIYSVITFTYIYMYTYVCVSWKVAKVHQDASRNSDEWKFGTQLVSKSPVLFFCLSITETNWNSNRDYRECFLFFLWNVSLKSM